MTGFHGATSGLSTRDGLIALADHVKVYEGGSISIVFRLAGELRRVQEYMEGNTPAAAV